MSPSFHPPADGIAAAAQPRRAESGSRVRPVTPSAAATAPHRDTIEARLGARLAQTLGEASSTLTPDVVERLRFAREAALARAAQQRRMRASGRASPFGWWHGLRALKEWTSAWQGAAAAVPLLVLVVGLVLIDHQMEQEELHSLADIDTLLLSDGLPPAAYSDPGFAEFLRNEPPP